MTMLLLSSVVLHAARCTYALASWWEAATVHVVIAWSEAVTVQVLSPGQSSVTYMVMLAISSSTQ